MSHGFLLFLRDRVTLEIHLESMGRFYQLFGRRINRTLHVGVFSLVHCCEDVKVAFPTFLLPVNVLKPVHLQMDKTYSRVLGHNRAAFRIYSGPRTKLFHLLTALRWSRLALNSDASSLKRISHYSNYHLEKVDHTLWYNADNMISPDSACNR